MPLDDRIDHDTGQVKVKLPIRTFPGQGDKPSGEHVWCTPAGPDHYVIDNIPVFTDAYHFGDTIEAFAVPTGRTCACCPNEWLEAKRVCVRGPWETRRWRFDPYVDPPAQGPWLEWLSERSGCFTEGGAGGYMASCVPTKRQGEFENLLREMRREGVVAAEEGE